MLQYQSHLFVSDSKGRKVFVKTLDPTADMIEEVKTFRDTLKASNEVISAQKDFDPKDVYEPGTVGVLIGLGAGEHLFVDTYVPKELKVSGKGSVVEGAKASK